MSNIELQPSKLGTKAHWDNVYEEELENFAQDGDEGEIWFGEESVEKMVDWTLEYLPPTSQPSILEIGSGNGTLLFALAENSYTPHKMSGIDYSPDAIKLAQAIALSRGVEQITFSLCDFLTENPRTLENAEQDGRPRSWDLVLDKGTFDAIALMEKSSDGTMPRSQYPKKVAKLLRPGGHFLITSCNFTEEELKSEFITPETGLQYHSRIQHPTFTFGGKAGSVVSTVAFQNPCP